MRRFTCLAGLALMLLWGQAAHALTFRIIPDDGLKRRVLLVYDCGWLAADSTPCLSAESSFSGPRDYFDGYKTDAQRDHLAARARALGGLYEVHPKEKEVAYRYAGDAAFLQRFLSQESIAEVWLLSNGGDVVAGLGIGKTLRDRGVAVRVPSALRMREARHPLRLDRPAQCVSSCTIAFMGGVLRNIDDGASYQVHSGSTFSGLSGARLERIRAALAPGGRGLQSLADDINQDARSSLRDELIHYHDTLLLPLGERNTQAERMARDRELNAWVLAAPARFAYPPAEQERDRRIIELEGDAALQDIFMRIERQAVNYAVADVRPIVPKLGRRADAALAMFVAMYDTASIKETNMMARETLLGMGYITEDVK